MSEPKLVLGTNSELTTIEQDIDKLGATALRIADERNRYKADAEHLLAQWDVLKYKHDALLETAKAVWKMLETGVLVRDTSKDHEPDWVLKQMPLVRVLAMFGKAIDLAERP
jgi:hypothetical protein